jgi:hypothetical protein
VRRLLCVLPVVLALTACVGPVRSTGQYEGKAAHTAAEARSQLETARLAVDNAGRMPSAYLETVLVDAEEAFGSIETTFDSIQPPDDPAADKLRTQLDDLLSDGSDGISTLRILARRGDAAGLAATARQLRTTSDGLDRFNEEHDS